MFDILTFAQCTDHLDGTGVIAELESTIANFAEIEYVLGMPNATTALHTLFDAFDLVPGDEVILPSLTAAETVAPLLHKGCTLVFADVDASLTLDPNQVERAITPRTRAIVAVDLFGQPHDTSAIRAIADESGVAYLVDSAQSFGARRDGKTTGYAADAVVLSLNAQKDLAAGEGGILLTNDRELYEYALRTTQHPRRQARELGESMVNEFSMRNGRLSPLSAAAAVARFPSVLDRIAQRRHEAAAVISLLNASGLITPITTPPGSEPTWSCITAGWRGIPQPVQLLTMLHHEGQPMRLRSLPVKALHTVVPHDQCRVPAPLPQTAAALQRCCLERRHP